MGGRSRDDVGIPERALDFSKPTRDHAADFRAGLKEMEGGPTSLPSYAEQSALIETTRDLGTSNSMTKQEVSAHVAMTDSARQNALDTGVDSPIDPHRVAYLRRCNSVFFYVVQGVCVNSIETRSRISPEVHIEVVWAGPTKSYPKCAMMSGEAPDFIWFIASNHLIPGIGPGTKISGTLEKRKSKVDPFPEGGASWLLSLDAFAFRHTSRSLAGGKRNFLNGMAAVKYSCVPESEASSKVLDKVFEGSNVAVLKVAL
jgi:hypothetical protein